MARPVETMVQPARDLKHAIRLLRSARNRIERYETDPEKALAYERRILIAESGLEEMMIDLRAEHWVIGDRDEQEGETDGNNN